MSLTIVARKYWGAVSAFNPTPLELPIKYVLSQTVHSHTCETDDQCRKLVKRLELIKRGDTIYSFLVGGNGMVYESSGFYNSPEVPKRVRHIEDRTLYIGLIGHYGEETPEIMLESQKALIDYGVSSGIIDPKYVFMDDLAQAVYKTVEPRHKIFFVHRQKPSYRNKRKKR